MADNVIVDGSAEWWYSPPADIPASDAYTGTYMGITRTTEPMWRSTRVTPTSNYGFNVVWFDEANKVVFSGLDSKMPDCFNPDLQLQEGL